MLEAKARVSCEFYVECPHCKKQNKYTPIIYIEGDALRERFKAILQRLGGETRITCECESCRKYFVVTSFLV